MAKKDKDKSLATDILWIEFFAKISNRIGKSGLITIVISLYLVCYATPQQREQIIDQWVLYRSHDYNIIFYTLTISLLFILFFAQNYHSTILIESFEKRIDELAKEKNDYQQIVIGKNLSSSKS